MNDSMIVALIGFIGALIVVMTPVIKLNGKISELTVLLAELKGLVKEKTDKLDERVTTHGKEIDEIKLTQAQHETRIQHLEEHK